MSELILHHYPLSPFAEKVRRILAAKQLPWQAVLVPMVAPKPDLVALTGGYRRTPVLQIGADLLCDTALIARFLDGLSAEPPLFAEPPLLTTALVRWAETELFGAAMGLCFQPAGQASLFEGWSAEQRAALLQDRRRMAEGGTRLRMNGQDAATALQCHLELLAGHLADGRAWLPGDRPGIVDFAVWPSLWSIRRLPPLAPVLSPWPAVLDWMARMAAIGEAPPDQVLTGAEAIDVAHQSEPQYERIMTLASARPDRPAPASLAPGARVEVMPNDNAFDPVAGVLVGLAADHVAIEREDARAGRVVVHFPRLGYTVKSV